MSRSIRIALALASLTATCARPAEVRQLAPREPAPVLVTTPADHEPHEPHELGEQREQREHDEEPDAPRVDGLRGLGTLTARVPGTTPIVTGVRLTDHRVRVTVRDGLARTEVEEEFHNDTLQVLEGHYSFRLPEGASVSRLALWVGEELVEAEVVERKRARAIFQQIVEDTVRPRDPALLEWVRGSTFSLKIFPIPAKRSRRLVLAYDEVLERVGERFVYRYPLASAAPVARFELAVDSTDEILAEGSELDGAGRFEASEFRPRGDLVFYLAAPSGVLATGQAARGPGAGHVALRVPIPDDVARSRRLDRVVVIDTSASQSTQSLALAREHLALLLSSLAPHERFAVLACDSACDAYPREGLAPARAEHVAAAAAFARGLVPGGSSDLGGALLEASRRCDHAREGQVVYLGDGAATAGARAPAAIAEQVVSSGAALDYHLSALGPEVDGPALRALAAALGATMDHAGRPAALARDLRRAPLRDVSWELPDGLEEVLPRRAPALRAGQELRLVARALPRFAGGAVRVRARRGDASVEVVGRVEEIRADNPLTPRLWAAAKLEELDLEPTRTREAVALSKSHHVLSRHTALLALESEQMFADFGVERTQRLPGVAPARPRAVRSVPSLRMGLTVVTGRVPHESVQRTLRFRIGAFRACYERALLRDPKLAGRVSLRFVIGRDGLVAHSSATGELAEAAPDVRACIARAIVGVAFPPPVDGIVVVEYPLVFSSDGSRPMRPATLWPNEPIPVPKWSPPDPPSYWGPAVQHRAGDERWRAEAEPRLQRARRALERRPDAPASHEGLVRAATAAERFVALDPVRPAAREVLGYSLAATGDARGAARAFDAYVELAPEDGDGRVRAAHALDALGDHTRACAHRRALGEECAVPKRAELERLTVAVQCDAKACPLASVLTPRGSVVSPLELRRLYDGTFRVLLAGGTPGSRGEVTVRALGVSRSFAFVVQKERWTVASTTLSGLEP